MLSVCVYMRSDDKQRKQILTYSDDPMKPTVDLSDDTAKCVRLAHLRLTYCIVWHKK